ncbi:MAG TPA: hypothetical protein EYP62_00760 [Kiritimatiellae bacterium]|nr:hypothetical protein [Kiritimatiellia bacterium]
MRIGKTGIFFMLSVLAALKPEPTAGESLLNAPAESLLYRALECMNLDPSDLDFARDVADPRLVIPAVRDGLRNVLSGPRLGREIENLLRDRSPDELLGTVRRWLSITRPMNSTPPEPQPGGKWPPDATASLSQPLASAVAEFLIDVEPAFVLASGALDRLAPETRAYLWARHVTGMFNAEDRPHVRHAIMSAGLSSQVLWRVIRESQQLDPEPYAVQYYDAVELVSLDRLLPAAALIYRAARRLSQKLKHLEDWPRQMVRIPTGRGVVVIGSTSDDVHREAALLVVDPGGNDRYYDAAAAFCLGTGTAISVVLDLEGDDTYSGTKVAGTATAVFGISILIDLSGADTYRDPYCGSASSFCGVGILEDRRGSDIYDGWAFSQGAAVCGVALLRDLQGDDHYAAGLCSQAFSGPLAAGFLVDHEGDDVYVAGGREPDYERHDDRFLSLSQACSVGDRPFAGGGIAFLLDQDGNDTYIADVYGQGVAYWYAFAALVDANGNDAYSVYHYGQGAGIHLACGILCDQQGGDTYQGYILTQGAAHDYAVGMLLDDGGDDTYCADHHSQGRAINNAVALLIDSNGDDGYFARQPQRCQGVGNMGGDREYGSLALLLDLAGKDYFSCGAPNGGALLRPMDGIVYDYSEPIAPEAKE